MPNLFRYDTFQIADDRQTVHFSYLLTHDETDYPFTESLRFPMSLPATTTIDRSLRALHLALGVSYYKIFAPPTIEHPYAMSSAEATFWNDIWRNGLGEFLYRNKLSPAILAQFEEQDGVSYDEQPADTASGILLGLGGGKDSVLAGELLKSCGQSIEAFVMATGEQLGQTQAVADTMEVALHVVARSIDRSLLEVQELPGAHQGHVPISLIFGLVGTTLAIATDKAYVVVANEASASVPHISWEHGMVNHQWTKSLEFELGLQTFITHCVASSPTYFSAVRQLTSLGVAKLFAHYPQYYEVFTSDNLVFRIDPAKRPNARWSLESAKSLSSFILLAPWLSEADMVRTFGRDFLDESGLEKLFWELLGREGTPPWDCVGTVDELVLSLNLAAQQQKFSTSSLMQLARQRGVVNDNDWQPALNDMLSLQVAHAIPADLHSQLAAFMEQGLSA